MTIGTRYIIDTCVISELTTRRPSSHVVEWFRSIRDDDMYISVVTLGELRKGIDKLALNDPRRSKLESWLSKVRDVFADRIVPFEEDVALKWGSILGECARVGKSRSPIDAQIAATAIVRGFTLVTRNVADFTYTGVSMENPFE